MLLSHLLAFCRITIGLVFTISFLGKVRNVDRFAQTITSFQLLPRQLSKAAAILFLTGELVVVILLILGRGFLPIAFAAAFLLLLTFSVALLSVVTRNIQTACNCFGVKEEYVTYHDVWRNVGYTVCSLVGWRIWLLMEGSSGNQTLAELVLISPIAIVFVVVWTHLRHMTRLFQ